MGSPSTTVTFTADVSRALAEAALRARPREMVGLLGGPDADGGAVTCFLPLPNAAVADDRFAVDPQAFATAETALRARGLRFLGFAHSHLHGSATLSPTDRAELWPACLQVVIALSDDERFTLAAWRRDGPRWSALTSVLPRPAASPPPPSPTPQGRP